MNGIKIFLLAIVVSAATLMSAGCSRVPQLPMLAADATILAFGDSLTAGTGAAETESYPAVLAQLIGRKVINAGVPGEVTAIGLQRLPEFLEREKPALLILCHGGNDLLGHQNHQQISENMRAMIRIAGEHGVKVMLVAVPSPDLSLKAPLFYDEIAKEFNIPIERKVLSAILAKRTLKSDYIHPNAAGYRKFAEALALILKKSGAIT